MTKDRVCTACGTRYRPPPPTWLLIIAILVGVAFLVFFGGIYLLITVQRGPTVNPICIVGLGLGFLAVYKGIQGLMQS